MVDLQRPAARNESYDRGRIGETTARLIWKLRFFEFASLPFCHRFFQI